jgi:hypothetical protein
MRENGLREVSTLQTEEVDEKVNWWGRASVKAFSGKDKGI